MDADQRTQFVIHEMRRYRKVDDIVFALCQATGQPWNDTAMFVNHVMAANQDKIQAERQPLVVAIGVALIVAGFGTMTGVMIATLDGWIVFLLRLPIPYLGNALLFLFGLVMLMGGVQGLLQMALKSRRGPE